MNTTSTQGEHYRWYDIKPQLSPKSRLVALLLAWFLGIFGDHSFYVGRTGSAIAQLALSLNVVGLLVSIPWVLIDLIMIAAGVFRDGEGLQIKSWESKQ
jgi:TM2 domain-containing membrane protein YozV